jgi:hypothetical protein
MPTSIFAAIVTRSGKASGFPPDLLLKASSAVMEL